MVVCFLMAFIVTAFVIFNFEKLSFIISKFKKKIFSSFNIF